MIRISRVLPCALALGIALIVVSEASAQGFRPRMPPSPIFLKPVYTGGPGVQPQTLKTFQRISPAMQPINGGQGGGFGGQFGGGIGGFGGGFGGQFQGGFGGGQFGGFGGQGGLGGFGGQFGGGQFGGFAGVGGGIGGKLGFSGGSGL